MTTLKCTEWGTVLVNLGFWGDTSVDVKCNNFQHAIGICGDSLLFREREEEIGKLFPRPKVLAIDANSGWTTVSQIVRKL